ncbi:uncharacterized protein LOC144731209 isoform X1 [Lampetra planeri]
MESGAQSKRIGFPVPNPMVTRMTRVVPIPRAYLEMQLLPKETIDKIIAQQSSGPQGVAQPDAVRGGTAGAQSQQLPRVPQKDNIVPRQQKMVPQLPQHQQQPRWLHQNAPQPPLQQRTEQRSGQQLHLQRTYKLFSKSISKAAMVRKKPAPAAECVSQVSEVITKMASTKDWKMKGPATDTFTTNSSTRPSQQQPMSSFSKLGLKAPAGQSTKPASTTITSSTRPSQLTFAVNPPLPPHPVDRPRPPVLAMAPEKREQLAVENVDSCPGWATTSPPQPTSSFSKLGLKAPVGQSTKPASTTITNSTRPSQLTFAVNPPLPPHPVDRPRPPVLAMAPEKREQLAVENVDSCPGWATTSPPEHEGSPPALEVNPLKEEKDDSDAVQVVDARGPASVDNGQDAGPKPKTTSHEGVNPSGEGGGICSSFAQSLTATNSEVPYETYNQQEREELKRVSAVWYLGTAKRLLPRSGIRNDGYDNDKGFYIHILHEHINFRYEVLKKLGSGSNAVVLKCMDHKTMELVAIKIFRNARGIKANVQKEVEILKRLCEKDFNNDHNIIRLRETFSFRRHHCICLELAGLDLRKAMKTAETVPTMQSVRLYARALLKCLSLLRKEGISHGDLKPENIVLIQNTIKTINFGLSCYGERALSDIQRIWYSAPEAILGLKSSSPMDMWSLGCIIAELYSGEILFPGHHDAHQLALIMEVLGVPPPSMIRASPLKTTYFDECNKPRVVLDHKWYLKPPGSVKLKRRLNASNEDFIDFIRQCLTWDPEQRMSPDKAMDHPWIRSTKNF